MALTLDDDFERSSIKKGENFPFKHDKVRLNDIMNHSILISFNAFD
jgi:hypothetical protein